MSNICPTITSYTPETYKQQIELVTTFANRIHIDFMDGVFAPTVSPSVQDAWWPKKVKADLHIMIQDPMTVLHEVLAHHPNLVIVHAESEHVSSFVHALHEHRIKVGIAILQDTSVEVLNHFINVIDHVLIFSGKLGCHGGEANLELLEKVRWVRSMRQDMEIGWDGGIDNQNIVELRQAGVTVFNVGGYIHKSESPESAYKQLAELVQS